MKKLGLNYYSEYEILRPKIKLFGFSLLLLILFYSFYYPLLALIIRNQPLAQISVTSLTINNFEHYTFIEFLFFTLMVAPFFEESVCRAWINFELNGIALLIAGLLYYLSRDIFVYRYFVYFRVCYSLLFFFILQKGFKYLKYHPVTNTNILLTAYVFSSFLFAIIHLNNFKLINQYSILFILPQLVGGFILGYVRYKNGFLWAVALHFLNNLPVTMLYCLKHYY